MRVVYLFIFIFFGYNNDINYRIKSITELICFLLHICTHIYKHVMYIYILFLQ